MGTVRRLRAMSASFEESSPTTLSDMFPALGHKWTAKLPSWGDIKTDRSAGSSSPAEEEDKKRKTIIRIIIITIVVIL